MTMIASKEVENLRDTAMAVGMLCEWLVDVIDAEALTVELLESVLHDLEVGDHSLYSAVSGCIEPVGY